MISGQSKALDRGTRILLVLGTVVLFVICLFAEKYQRGALLAAPVVAVAAVVLVAACLGKPWALKICLFVLIFTMDAQLGRSETSDVAIDPQTIIRFAIWMALFLVGLANLPSSIRYFRNIPNLALVAYFLMALLSALYSPIPKYTIGCAAGYLFTFVFSAAAVARLDFKSLMITAMIGVGSHVVIAMGLLAISPDLAMWEDWAGSGRRLAGLLGHPFRMAENAALFVLCAWAMWRLRWLPTPALLLMGGLGVTALVLTDERTAIAAFALSLLALGPERKASIVAVVGVVAAVLIAVLTVPNLLTDLASEIGRNGDPNRAMSLTGRTYIWATSLGIFYHQPILGYGFASTRLLLAEQFFRVLRLPPHAHNVVIQSLVTMGIVGTALLMIPIIGQLVFALRHRDSPLNVFVCFGFLEGFMTVSTIGTTPNVLTIFWLISLLLMAPAAKSRPDAATILGSPTMTPIPGRGSTEDRFCQTDDNGKR